MIPTGGAPADLEPEGKVRDVDGAAGAKVNATVLVQAVPVVEPAAVVVVERERCDLVARQDAVGQVVALEEGAHRVHAPSVHRDHVPRWPGSSGCADDGGGGDVPRLAGAWEDRGPAVRAGHVRLRAVCLSRPVEPAFLAVNDFAAALEGGGAVVS